MASSIPPINKEQETYKADEQNAPQYFRLCSFDFLSFTDTLINPLANLKDRLICALPQVNLDFNFFQNRSEDHTFQSRESSWQKLHRFNDLPSHEQSVEGYYLKLSKLFSEIGSILEIELDAQFDGITGHRKDTAEQVQLDLKKGISQLYKDLSRGAKILCLGIDIEEIPPDEIAPRLRTIFNQYDEMTFLRVISGLNHGVFTPARCLTESIFNRKFLVMNETEDLFSEIDLEKSFAASGFSSANSGIEPGGILGIQNWEDSPQNFHLKVVEKEGQLTILAKKEMHLKKPWESWHFEYAIEIQVNTGVSKVTFSRLA